MNVKPWMRPVIMLFEAVAYLHQNGYEKIRLMSYFGAVGYFRVCISLKKNFDNITGFIVRDGFATNEDEIYRYSEAGGYCFFSDESDMKDASVEELANKLLKKFPAFEKEGKGSDKEYVDWFAKVLKMVEKGNFPYALEEYGYNIYKLGKIKFIYDDVTIEYAPPGDRSFKLFKGD